MGRRPESQLVQGSLGKAAADVRGPFTLTSSLEFQDEVPLSYTIGDKKFMLRLTAGEFLGRSPEVRRLQRSLYEELTAIVMRRVVPGHGEYCPI